MITIEKIPEQELKRLRQKVKNDFSSLFWTMIAFVACFGLVLGKLMVAIICGGIVCLVFLIVKSAGSPINGNIKIIRRNKVVEAKLKKTGRRVRHTTIHIVMDKDVIPTDYTQTDTFMVYHSYGLSGVENITPHNYQLLKGKEVEITYMASTGFVIELKILVGVDKSDKVF